ncbi:MAG TPA: hypothetical protein VFS67_30800 [Polyangiaceae bacterium]|jgi:hypothetical protein|nr:hypothetical protein [Polyangiaceae bacterium]
MSYLYGDSTTFPYDVDYIELSRHGVECAMQLLSAQHAIASALAREEAQSQARNLDRTRLSNLAEAVESALAPFLNAESELVVRAAARALQSTKTALEDERAEADRRANDGATHAQHVIQRASESAHRALETFLSRHDVPETELGLTLSCNGEQGYSGEIAIRSPFGVRATFALRAGAEHDWLKPRRVADLAPGLEIHVPQPSGWISKRIEMAPVKLDRLFFGSVRVAGAELELVLTKSASSGAGYRISVDLRGERGVLVTPLNENGVADADPPLTLDAEDGARLLELAQGVIESVQGLTALRGSMCSVSLDDQPLEQVEWPETAAHRLLSELAPVVLEISRRSGAPGELVLRRDVGGGRREEIYVTKAELWERLLVLPPERRAVFGVLGLTAPTLAPAEPPPVSGTISVAPDPSMFEVPVEPVLASMGPA